MISRDARPAAMGIRHGIHSESAVFVHLTAPSRQIFFAKLRNVQHIQL
jgi:hypothetical protein